jgi:hypothetical protein
MKAQPKPVGGRRQLEISARAGRRAACERGLLGSLVRGPLERIRDMIGGGVVVVSRINKGLVEPIHA